MYRTLILTNDYRPYETVDWKDAVTRMFSGKLEVLVQYDEALTVIGRNHLNVFPELKTALRQVIGTDAESITIHVPAVAVLRRAVRRVKKTGIKFSKVNVYTRDGGACQYCGDNLPINKVNYDHVIPRSRWKGPGSPTTWDNIVISCYGCNTKKADMTPEEAGMALRSTPKKPDSLPLVRRVSFDMGENVPEEWLPYVAA